MTAHRLGLASGILILLISLGMLAGSAWPASQATRRIQLPASKSLSAAHENWQEDPKELELRSPRWLQVGEQGRISLLIENIPRIDSEALKDQNLPRLAVRLELPGIPFSPAGEIYRIYHPDQLSSFTWQVISDYAGVYSGTIWIHELAADPAGGNDSRKVLLSALPIQVKVIRLVGLSKVEAQIVGFTGVLVALVIMFFGIRKNVNADH